MSRKCHMTPPHLPVPTKQHWLLFLAGYGLQVSEKVTECLLLAAVLAFLTMCMCIWRAGCSFKWPRWSPFLATGCGFILPSQRLGGSKNECQYFLCTATGPASNLTTLYVSTHSSKFLLVPDEWLAKFSWKGWTGKSLGSEVHTVSV